MSTNIDTDVSNYSIAELMAISDITTLNTQEVTEKTNALIIKVNKSNPVLAAFFIDVQTYLLQHANSNDDPIQEGFLNYGNNDLVVGATEETFTDNEEQVRNWYQNEALSQLPPNTPTEEAIEKRNKSQSEKITDRKQKIDIFDSAQFPMNRQQLGLSNNFQVPVAQDSLNPNLKNTITRFINLDSQFRQYSSQFETSATDYTLDLSDPLTNALNMRLYSYQIPFSWYSIDISLGNTCFWITETIFSTDGIPTTYNVPVSIFPGNYTAVQLVDVLIKSFVKAGFTFTYPTPFIPVTYDTTNGKLTLNLYNGDFTSKTINDVVIPSFRISTYTIITFYDETAQLQCESACVNKSFYFNQTLGWIMGFRTPFVDINENGNVGSAVVDLIGTKYLILVVDDYNQNHVNNGLVSIAEYSNNLKVPSYYSPDLPYVCVVSDNFEKSSTQVLVPSAPRTLTNSQLYTINEINKNRNSNTNHRAKAPTTTDILGIIPIKTSGVSVGTLLVEFSGSLQDNVRTYFGPVNVDRIRIRLLNDRGNPINLNGLDWCITLICECLYQY